MATLIHVAEFSVVAKERLQFKEMNSREQCQCSHVPVLHVCLQICNLFRVTEAAFLDKHCTIAVYTMYSVDRL